MKTFVVDPGYLVYEDGATQAPPPSLTGLVEGAVLCNYHHVNSDAVVTGLLCSQSKVEAVAGVVLHDDKHSGGPCGGKRDDILGLTVIKINTFYTL